MNSKPRIESPEYADEYPDVMSVYRENLGWVVGGYPWRVYRGWEEFGNGFETFAEAIEYAQKQARQ